MQSDYRLVKHTEENGFTYYRIHKVSSHKGKLTHSYDFLVVQGYSESEVRLKFSAMKQAFAKPILEEKIVRGKIKLVEVKND